MTTRYTARTAGPHRSHVLFISARVCELRHDLAGADRRDRPGGPGPSARARRSRGSPCGELADPAHPLGGRLGVVAELLCHPAGAAAGTEPAHGAAGRDGHAFGDRCVRSLQRGGEQCLTPRVVDVQPGLAVLPAVDVLAGAGTGSPGAGAPRRAKRTGNPPMSRVCVWTDLPGEMVTVLLLTRRLSCCARPGWRVRGWARRAAGWRVRWTGAAGCGRASRAATSWRGRTGA